MSTTAELLVLPEAHGVEPVPAHVPPELVRPFPYILGAIAKTDPHSFIKALHEGPEVIWAERCFYGLRGAWVPRKLEDLQHVYYDTEHYTARGFVTFAELIGETWYFVPAELDPPMHEVLRAAINPLFTPKRMAALEEKIRGYAREAVASFRERGTCEFMHDFAFEFPVKVFLELMGLPQSDVKQFLAWEHGFIHEHDIEKIKDATRAVVDYLRREIEDRRINPRNDFISFGYGPHLCLGMHLARREMRLAMEEMLTGLPEFRLKPGADMSYYLAAVIQPVELPLVWNV